jgi:UDP-2-acetamido-3-amino-2,3-dideoxy-glucuronate N-acetyltransferase
MAVFDDTNPAEPLRFYDRDVRRDKEYGDFGEFHLVLRDGAISIPHVRMEEPLKAELGHFIDCVRRRARPETGGAHGADVVAVIAAMERSLRAGGSRTRVRG